MAGPYNLQGSGQQTIASPSRLKVVVTSMGSLGREGRANPPNLYDIGLLTPGNADGWYRAIPISMSPQLIDLPIGCTLLGYSLLGNAQITVTELPSAVGQLATWDDWDALNLTFDQTDLLLKGP